MVVLPPSIPTGPFHMLWRVPIISKMTTTTYLYPHQRNICNFKINCPTRPILKLISPCLSLLPVKTRILSMSVRPTLSWRFRVFLETDFKTAWNSQERGAMQSVLKLIPVLGRLRKTNLGSFPWSTGTDFICLRLLISTELPFFLPPLSPRGFPRFHLLPRAIQRPR